MVFREVYDTHLAFVWRSLRRLGVSESSLKDAMQDVFLVVHRRLPEFEGRAQLTTWLFRICLRVARDHRRRAHVRREVLDDTQIAASADPRADAVEGIERQEDFALFEDALAQLDLDQRTVFMLFELEDMSGPEIAETLMIPLGTVYSRLRLARVEFKRAVVRAAARRASHARTGGMS